mgnify:CR=1 FL=1
MNWKWNGSLLLGTMLVLALLSGCGGHTAGQRDGRETVTVALWSYQLNRPVAVGIAAQVGLGKGGGQPGVAQVRQRVLPVRHIVQGKAPQGQNIRQIPLPLLEAVEVR